MTTIPELATQIIHSTPKNENNSSTIVLLGSSSVGKSTLLQTFLEKSEVPKKTLVLEYSYARKNNQKHGVIEKSIAHVWEYGGNLNMMKTVIPSIPLKGRVTFCIMVDLSKIKTIWNTLELCLAAVDAVSSEKYDVVLIGGKYDVYKNFDNETKKLIATTLRSIAILKHCHIFYYSSKDAALVRRGKEVIHSIAFGNGFLLKDKIAGINKPIYIPKGLDSWEAIGVNYSNVSQVKSIHLSVVPLEVEEIISNPTFTSSATSSHYEHQLDSLFNAQYDELRSIANYDMNLADCL